VIQCTNVNFPSNMTLFFFAHLNSAGIWNSKIMNLWDHKIIIFGLYTYLCSSYVFLCVIMTQE